MTITTTADLKSTIASMRQQLAESHAREAQLRNALEITHELYAEASSGYGFARPDNPHNFSCDIDCCSKEEIEAHSKACSDYAAGRKISGDSWGIGAYCDEYEPAIKALSLPQDDTALREWGAKLLEKVARECDISTSLYMCAKSKQLISGEWKP